jgi:hypothetical protein
MGEVRPGANDRCRPGATGPVEAAPAHGLPIGAREVTMSAIVRSWIRIFCPKCGHRATFLLEGEWTVKCTECGHERPLKDGMLVR